MGRSTASARNNDLKEQLTMNGKQWKQAIACAALAAAPAASQAQIANGGFEAGLAGWTVANQAGSDGSFFVQTGSVSPLNGIPVQPPPQGLSAAMTDAGGPGSHLLYQDFVVPTAVSTATLSFQLYVRSDAAFVAPDHLDFAGSDLNQQVRVDLLSTAADPFSTAVLMNLFQSQPTDPLEFGYTLFTFDVAGLLQAHAGQTLRLRFAEVDNVFIQNLGVDAVSLAINAAPIPEPATVWMLLAGLGALAFARRRRA
jgi:hypothetical protein